MKNLLALASVALGGWMVGMNVAVATIERRTGIIVLAICMAILGFVLLFLGFRTLIHAAIQFDWSGAFNARRNIWRKQPGESSGPRFEFPLAIAIAAAVLGTSAVIVGIMSGDLFNNGRNISFAVVGVAIGSWGWYRTISEIRRRLRWSRKLRHT